MTDRERSPLGGVSVKSCQPKPEATEKQLKQGHTSVVCRLLRPDLAEFGTSSDLARDWGAPHSHPLTTRTTALTVRPSLCSRPRLLSQHANVAAWARPSVTYATDRSYTYQLSKRWFYNPAHSARNVIPVPVLRSQRAGADHPADIRHSLQFRALGD